MLGCCQLTLYLGNSHSYIGLARNLHKPKKFTISRIIFFNIVLFGSGHDSVEDELPQVNIGGQDQKLTAANVHSDDTLRCPSSFPSPGTRHLPTVQNNKAGSDTRTREVTLLNYMLVRSIQAACLQIKLIGDHTGAYVHSMAHQHHHQHNGRHGGGHRLETVIDMAQQQPEKPAGVGRFGFTGGLEFTGLTYTVVKKQRGAGGEWEKKDVDLLHEITGYAPKGCVTAVMGPSGAGKSTFLDALAGRIASLDGRVALDGVEMSPSLIKRSSAYVMQDDRLFPMLTVYETLMFAADFRLGSSVSASDKKLRVENLIEQLGLTVRYFFL